MNYFKPLLILTAFTAVLGLGKTGAVAGAGNISEIQLSLPLHSVQIAAKTDRTFKTSKGTLKPGSVLSVDPDEVRGIPKAEARRRFILNKIYRVQEGTTADDLFIVDEKANKWAVENGVHLTLANISVGAKHDRSQDGIITNNLYAVMLRPLQK
jgi:hypothetical protein